MPEGKATRGGGAPPARRENTVSDPGNVERGELEVSQRNAPGCQTNGGAAGLLQLDQHAMRGRWMDEGHERAFRPGTRFLVDQADAS